MSRYRRTFVWIKISNKTLRHQRNNMSKWYILGLCSICLWMTYSCKQKQVISPAAQSAQVERELIERLAHAQEGEVIELPEGKYDLVKTLHLAHAKNVTLRGQGIDKTILSCRDSLALSITADNANVEDMTLADLKGNGIMVSKAMNVNLKRIRVKWSSPNAHGAYGLSCTSCTNILIDACEIIGAMQAGITIYESRNVVVRKNATLNNATGIILANSIDVDVYENAINNNATGLVILDVPNLTIKNGMRTRVHQNRIYDNNSKSITYAYCGWYRYHTHGYQSMRSKRQ
jgi:parallel beta-helix repeat protein